MIALVKVEFRKHSCPVQVANDIFDCRGDVSFALYRLFGPLMSTHGLISSGRPGFGGVTIGDTHGVRGPSTFFRLCQRFLVLVVCLPLFSSHETGCGCTVGRTLLSMCSLTL